MPVPVPNIRPKVLMLGWEYPPAFTGGLGVATQGLVEAMRHHADILLMLPASLSSLEQPKIKRSRGKDDASALLPIPAYAPYNRYAPVLVIAAEVISRAQELREKTGDAQDKIYGHDLLEQVQKYSDETTLRAAAQTFDVIHAHDWMTFPAALRIKEASGKPLILHIHSLETDRSSVQAKNPIYDIERHAISQADKVLAVSDYTKEMLVTHYAAKPESVVTVYNGTDSIDSTRLAPKAHGHVSEISANNAAPINVSAIAPTAEALQQPPATAEVPKVTPESNTSPKDSTFQALFSLPMNTEPTSEKPYWMGDYKAEEPKKKGNVLFLGRVTAQKGPLTFVRTAKKLLAEDIKVKFVVAGLGDQLEEMMQLAEDERISRHISFKGFVKRKKLQKLLKKTDILFMPSVSEPFGLVALEAAQMGIPVVASKQAGVAEVLPGVLVAEHWDSHTFARHISMLLEYKDLRTGMGKANQQAVERLTWDTAAKQIMIHYQALTGL